MKRVLLFSCLLVLCWASVGLPVGGPIFPGLYRWVESRLSDSTIIVKTQTRGFEARLPDSSQWARLTPLGLRGNQRAPKFYGWPYDTTQVWWGFDSVAQAWIGCDSAGVCDTLGIGGSGSSDSIGVDTSGSGGPDAYIFPSFIRDNRAGITLDVATDTLIIGDSITGGSGDFSDTSLVVSEAQGGSDGLKWRGTDTLQITTADNDTFLVIFGTNRTILKSSSSVDTLVGYFNEIGNIGVAGAIKLYGQIQMMIDTATSGDVRALFPFDTTDVAGPTDGQGWFWSAANSQFEIASPPGAAGGTGDTLIVNVGGTEYSIVSNRIKAKAGTNISFTREDSTAFDVWKIHIDTTLLVVTRALKADSAGKATNDGAGNSITGTYETITNVGKVMDDTTEFKRARDSVNAWDNGALIWANGLVPMTGNWAFGNFDLTGGDSTDWTAISVDRFWFNAGVAVGFPRTIGTNGQVLKLDTSADPDSLMWAADITGGTGWNWSDSSGNVAFWVDSSTHATHATAADTTTGGATRATTSYLFPDGTRAPLVAGSDGQFLKLATGPTPDSSYWATVAGGSPDSVAKFQDPDGGTPSVPYSIAILAGAGVRDSLFWHAAKATFVLMTDSNLHIYGAVSTTVGDTAIDAGAAVMFGDTLRGETASQLIVGTNSIPNKVGNYDSLHAGAYKDASFDQEDAPTEVWGPSRIKDDSVYNIHLGGGDDAATYAGVVVAGFAPSASAALTLGLAGSPWGNAFISGDITMVERHEVESLVVSTNVNTALNAVKDTSIDHLVAARDFIEFTTGSVSGDSLQFTQPAFRGDTVWSVKVSNFETTAGSDGYGYAMARMRLPEWANSWDSVLITYLCPVSNNIDSAGVDSLYWLTASSVSGHAATRSDSANVDLASGTTPQSSMQVKSITAADPNEYIALRLKVHIRTTDTLYFNVVAWVND